MEPFANSPRSPPFFALLQWLSVFASSAKVACPTRISSLILATILSASSLVLVTTCSFHEVGLRESLCLTRMCEHLTTASLFPALLSCGFVCICLSGSCGTSFCLVSASWVEDGFRIPCRCTTYKVCACPNCILLPSLSRVGLYASKASPSTLVPCVDFKSMRYTLPFRWCTMAACVRETPRLSTATSTADASRPSTTCDFPSKSMRDCTRPDASHTSKERCVCGAASQLGLLNVGMSRSRAKPRACCVHVKVTHLRMPPLALHLTSLSVAAVCRTFGCKARHTSQWHLHPRWPWCKIGWHSSGGKNVLLAMRLATARRNVSRGSTYRNLHVAQV
mmetsp:Transcript_7484/g.45975  ORF Transcript_7484/g.45975 Transcript_7484/m.45975 type:complete len:335 (-) Transcript_7484:2399-3403(-)